MSIKDECEAALASGQTSFDSLHRCGKCNGSRRYAKQGQCVECAIRRNVNIRAKQPMSKGRAIGDTGKRALVLQEAVDSYLKGDGLVEAAQRHGVGVSRLRNKLSELGVFRPLENVKLERALDMVRAGTPVAEAATVCFVSIASIERVLLAEGLISEPSGTDPELVESARATRFLKAFPAPRRAA